MPHTRDEYIGLMTHALGKTPDSRHNLYWTFNRAARALVTASEWSWRVRGPVSVSTVANQGFIELPADFAQVRVCYIPSAGAVQKVNVCTLETIAQLRALASSYVGTGNIYIYFPAWNFNELGVAPRAELAPIPTTNATPTFQMIYNCAWREIDDSDTLREVTVIPADFEHALILMARAFANNIENQDAALEDTAVKNELDRLRGEDSRRQVNFGRMSGGAGSRMTTSIASRRVVGMAQL